MFGNRPRSGNEPEPERWYLLPAMQHGARKKFRQRMLAAIIVGALTAGALATVIYLANRR